MRSWVTLAGVVGALTAASPAHGAVVEWHQGPCDLKYELCRPSKVTVKAAPGERNTLSVEVGKQRILVGDATASLTPEGSCEAAPDGAVTCPVASQLFVMAGDGDDVVKLAGTVEHGALLAGDRGDDRLEGGAGSESLTGGPGRDVLEGGRGGDTLFADDERVTSPDSFDGGGGWDRLSYARRRRGVVVDLKSGAAGRPGEGDRVVAVESLTGGRGDDVLRGDDGRNDLNGDGGRDILSGRAGRDAFSGGERVDGGAGADYVELSSGAEVRCGDGRDEVSTHAAEAPLDLDSGCERLGTGIDPPILLRAQMRRPRDPILRLRTFCSYLVPRCTRSVTVGARLGGSWIRIAQGRVRGRRGETTKAVVVRLTPRGQQALLRWNRLPVVVRIRKSDEDDEDEQPRFRMTLVLAR